VTRPREGQEGIPPVTDAHRELQLLAGRLKLAHEEQPANALVARELRMALESLMAAQSKGDAELDALFAEFGATEVRDSADA